MLKSLILMITSALVFLAGCHKPNIPTNAREIDHLWARVAKEDTRKVERLWARVAIENNGYKLYKTIEKLEDDYYKIPESIPYWIEALKNKKMIYKQIKGKWEENHDLWTSAFDFLKYRIPVVYDYDRNPVAIEYKAIRASRFKSKKYVPVAKLSEYRAELASIYQHWYSSIPDKRAIKYDERRRMFVTGKESEIETLEYAMWRRKTELRYFSSNNPYSEGWTEYNSSPSNIPHWIEALQNNEPIRKMISKPVSRLFPRWVYELRIYEGLFNDAFVWLIRYVPVTYDFEWSLVESSEYRAKAASIYQHWYSGIPDKTAIKYDEDMDVFLTGKESEEEILEHANWRKTILPSSLLNFDLLKNREK